MERRRYRPIYEAVKRGRVGVKATEFRPFDHSKDEEERLLDRFRDPNDPFKLLIVTFQ